MKWLDIVFLHGDDFTTDGFDDMGIDEMVDYMLQWQNGDEQFRDRDESPAGTEDRIFTVVRGDHTFELNVNYRQGYAGLCEVVKS